MWALAIARWTGRRRPDTALADDATDCPTDSSESQQAVAPWLDCGVHAATSARPGRTRRAAESLRHRYTNPTSSHAPSRFHASCTPAFPTHSPQPRAPPAVPSPAPATAPAPARSRAAVASHTSSAPDTCALSERVMPACGISTHASCAGGWGVWAGMAWSNEPRGCTAHGEGVRKGLRQCPRPRPAHPQRPQRPTPARPCLSACASEPLPLSPRSPGAAAAPAARRSARCPAAAPRGRARARQRTAGGVWKTWNLELGITGHAGPHIEPCASPTVRSRGAHTRRCRAKHHGVWLGSGRTGLAGAAYGGERQPTAALPPAPAASC